MSEERDRDPEALEPERSTALEPPPPPGPGPGASALQGADPDSAPAETEVDRGEPDEAETDGGEPSFFDDPGQITKTLIIVAVLVAAIYIFVPKLAGLEDALAQLGQANRWWIGVAVGAMCLAFASYVALFRGVIGDHHVSLNWSESYQITMAGLAATRLFSAGGAGGILLTYWALRKAGMMPKESARRMVAFLVLLYAVYALAVLVFGVLLRVGLVPGEAPVSVTLIPAAIAGVVIVAACLVGLIPGDLQARYAHLEDGRRSSRFLFKLAALPATTATGIRTAIEFMRSPSKGGVAILGAVGFWGANVLIIWASFKSLGVTVPLGEVVVGFFVGMVANLAPAPAGVGAVDGGLIGVFAIFGYPLETVIAAVLIYRLIAFYLPVPPGIIAFFQLRVTVARWERERGAGARREPRSAAGGPIPTS